MAQMIHGRERTNREILQLLQQIDEGYRPTLQERWALRDCTTLDLEWNNYSVLPESIGRLVNLQSLNLRDAQITVLPESIGQLTNLQTLDLCNAEIKSLPESIGQLVNLQTLNLSITWIDTLPKSIGQLVNLKALDLSGCQISTLPKYIGQLASLQTLNLRSTNITTLPDSIGQLVKLQMLNLRDTQITALPESIGLLFNLQSLLIGGTQISALPESIDQLTHLQELQLTDTQIAALPESIGQLAKLQCLGLGGTQITTLPKSLKGLKNLKELYIWETNIVSLPDWIGALPALRYLNLQGLALPSIPSSLAMCGLPFVDDENVKEGIVLKDVTLTEQDISIFLEQPELIPSLYEKDQITLRECRVIFLGDGASGKSYTIKRFRNEGIKETEEAPYTTSETPGVEILDYPARSGAEAFKIHFWDFGGQQLLHSMHRCFLTDETCYVVTVKTRETKANERARYWLRNVRAFAPKSPILLFVNCWENDDGRRSIDAPGLRKEFPNIKNVVYCSAKLAEEAEFRENVMESIVKMAAKSEGLTRKVPRKWSDIRQSIERESEKSNYLTKERYEELCIENGIEDDQAPALLSYFNTLGVCFSYHRDREKRDQADYKLLRPVWLTNAIYAIIEEGRVHAPEGRISREQIEQMLCNRAPDTVCGKQYRRTAPELIYQPIECPYILNVAITHDLCYPVDDTTLFFPALCGADTPAEALSDPEGYPQHVSYLLRYSYLPDSVLHQLMIRCMRNRLSVEKCWQRGMILYVWNLHEVIIRMTDDESLRIDVYSSREQPAYALFWALRREIEEINHKLNLHAEEYIVDGMDEFPLEAVLEAAKDKASIYGRGGKRNAEKLLGDFYEIAAVQNMRVVDGKIVISIPPREYHPCAKSNPALRSALYDAYNRICPYCNNLIQTIRDMEVDHILPSSYPGNDTLKPYLDYLISCDFDIEKPDYIENYFPTHAYCNRDISNRVNEFSLPYWHDIAAQHAPKVLKLMEKYKKQSE